jgi:hypothetical protein
VKRPRFVPCLLIGLLLLCLSAWAWSCPYREHVDYKAGPKGPQTWVFEIGGGAIFVGRNWGGWEGGAEDLRGWHYQHLGKDPFASDLDNAGFRLLGMQIFTSQAPPKGIGSFIMIPFWFLTIASTLALVIVWWRQNLRGKPSHTELRT